MYAASYFNSVGMFQRFAAWARDRRTTASPYPQEILFRATAVMMAVRSASQSAALCASKLDGVQFDTGDDSREVAFWCDDVVGLVGMVCHALSSLVVLQNQVIRLVGDTVEPRVEDLPKSLHGVMKQLDSLTCLPPEIRRATRVYWETIGGRVRDFRVLDQHYRLVSDAVRLVVGETPRISVLLPDNPESHARRNCTFSQRTDAVAFIDAALAGVHDYIERCAGILGFEPEPLLLSLPIGGMNLVSGPRRLLAVAADVPRQGAQTLLYHLEDGKVKAVVQNASPGDTVHLTIVWEDLGGAEHERQMEV